MEGTGETIETDGAVVRRSLEALGRCASIHGAVPLVTWRVSGRELALSPVEGDAAAVLMGDSTRDLGALVARLALERLGGAIAVDGGELRVWLSA